MADVARVCRTLARVTVRWCQLMAALALAAAIGFVAGTAHDGPVLLGAGVTLVVLGAAVALYRVAAAPPPNPR